MMQHLHDTHNDDKACLLGATVTVIPMKEAGLGRPNKGLRLLCNSTRLQLGQSCFHYIRNLLMQLSFTSCLNSQKSSLTGTVQVQQDVMVMSTCTA